MSTAESTAKITQTNTIDKINDEIRAELAQAENSYKELVNLVTETQNDISVKEEYILQLRAILATSTGEAPAPVAKKPGRPKGSKKGPGRPKGSKNKSRNVPDLSDLFTNP